METRRALEGIKSKSHLLYSSLRRGVKAEDGMPAFTAEQLRVVQVDEGVTSTS